MYLHFLAHDVFFVLIGLSMIGGDTLIVYVSCFILLIDLYLWGYLWYMSLFCVMWNQEVIYVLLVFSTHAFMCLLSVSGNIHVDSVVLLSTLATDR